jgi:hypothetical protein
MVWNSPNGFGWNDMDAVAGNRRKVARFVFDRLKENKVPRCILPPSFLKG